METAWKTFGHEPVKNILQKQIRGGNFAHAYLFCGPEGVGKKQLALEFAGKILETENLLSHPDFKILDEGEEEISIESIREFISTLSFKPFVAKKKIAVINNAHNLNIQSSNALLKTLEEPSGSTIIILVSSGKRLLPTILSRCQIFNFNLFSERQMAEFLKTQGKALDEHRQALCFGSVSRALRLAEAGAFYDHEKETAGKADSIFSKSREERLLEIPALAELEPEQLKQVFQNWSFWQMHKLKSDQKGFAVLGALTEALEQLKTNKNKKLILQGLFLKV